MATTPDKVRAIIPTDKTDIEIEVFIEMAQCILDQYSLSECYSETCVDTIHTWLTAHLIAVTNAEYNITSKGIDTAKDTYSDTISASTVADMGSLYATKWGQQVLIFDHCKKLSNLGNANSTSLVFESLN